VSKDDTNELEVNQPQNRKSCKSHPHKNAVAENGWRAKSRIRFVYANIARYKPPNDELPILAMMFYPALSGEPVKA
jgi:hypothetical protein